MFLRMIWRLRPKSVWTKNAQNISQTCSRTAILSLTSGHNPKALPQCWYVLIRGFLRLEDTNVQDPYALENDSQKNRERVRKILRELKNNSEQAFETFLIPYGSVNRSSLICQMSLLLFLAGGSSSRDLWSIRRTSLIGHLFFLPYPDIRSSQPPQKIHSSTA